MESFEQQGKASLREWLLRDETPKTKEAIERIMNLHNLTEVMFDAVSGEDVESVKELVGEYVELSPNARIPANKTRMKEIEKEVARIVEEAFDAQA